MAEISEKETQRYPAIPGNIHPQAIKDNEPTSALKDDEQTTLTSPTIRLASRSAKLKAADANQSLLTKPVLTNQIPRHGKSAIQARLLKERCRQLGLALFVDEHTTIQSLGITSTLEGEGKTFTALIMAQVLAEDGFAPVVLVDSNWEHPSVHEYFGIPSTPGLAEWLRGECSIEQIRYQIATTLTVIPAGDSKTDMVRLLRKLRDDGLVSSLTQHSDIVIVDLPAILTTAYGSLAASLPEALLMVTQAGSTPGPLLAEALGQISDLPLKSIILNQVESKIPRWIRQLF